MRAGAGFCRNDAGWAGASVLLVLGSALVILGSLGFLVQAGARQISRDAEALECRTRILGLLDRVASELGQVLAAPQGPSFKDWENLVRAWELQGIRVQELSSLINPNWIRPEILSGPGAEAMWKPGVRLEDFAQERSGLDPAVDVAVRYEPWFTPDTLERSMSPWARFNLAVGDEVCLAKAYALGSGDTSAADAFRWRIRNFRANGAVLDQAGADALLAPYQEELAGIMDWRPPVNVNLAPREILAAVLYSQALGFENPDALLNRILDLRNQGFVGPGELAGALKGHVRSVRLRNAWASLCSWLGDRSVCFELRCNQGEVMGRMVASYAADQGFERPGYQILRLEWPEGADAPPSQEED